MLSVCSRGCSVIGLAWLGVAGVAGAQPAGLPAVITVGGSGLDAAAIEGAVEHELGVPLVIEPSAVERLEITMTGRRANVTYYAPGREPVTRSVDLPRDPQRALETIAFLAGNLARDEASELLRQLSPTVPGSEPDEVPLPPPPLPPPPPPPSPPPAPKPAAPAAKPRATRLRSCSVSSRPRRPAASPTRSRCRHHHHLLLLLPPRRLHRSPQLPPRSRPSPPRSLGRCPQLQR